MMIMSKKKKKKRKSKKVDISLALSIIAILISFFSLPMVNKHFDKAKIEIIDLGLSKAKGENLMRKSYLLINNSGNSAKNVDLHMSILQSDWVFFSKKGFTMKEDDKLGGTAKNLVYQIEEFPSQFQLEITIFSPYSQYLKANNIDTLIYEKPLRKPQLYYGPYITEIIHSDGVQTPRLKEYIELKEANY